MARERALLVTVQVDPRFAPEGAAWPIEDEAAELRDLAASAGSQVVGDISAKRHQPIAGTFLGSGKLEEIARLVEESQTQVVIFNQELSPAQQRNIEDLLRVKTIDRTQLILDIFAQRAKSQEGKIQVELAQLRYLLPRLVGTGVMLSRLGGGIGTRGPGEQKLEVDRRKIRQRLSRLTGELEKLRRRREATRRHRKETDVPVVALIGYTNAGKTTLLNRLTGETSETRHQLFTTLDPLARRMRLPHGETIVLTDTVGFLHHLPHHLIEAFQATLEETRDADLLLHVLDASHPLVLEHVSAVEKVLERLTITGKPVITVLNKQDQVQDAARLSSLGRIYAPAMAVSAKTGEGLRALCQVVAERLGLLLIRPTHLRIPVERADLVASIYRTGQVLERREQDGVLEITVRLSAKLRSQLAAYVLREEPQAQEPQAR